MSDGRQDTSHTGAAAGLDLTAIHAALTGTMTREDRAIALVRAFGALRQRDLVQLMDVSSATISRLVTALLAAGKVREQAFKDGEVGRPTDWLLAPEGDPPSYQQRQTIIACLPDVIASLDTTPPSAALSSLSVHAAIEEPSISLADPPVHAAWNVPAVSREEPSAQMTLALWFGTAGEDSGDYAAASVATLASKAATAIASSGERFAPLPATTMYVPPPTRGRIQSPMPPWERSRFLSRPHWRVRALVRRGAAGLVHGIGQVLRLTLRLLMLGGCLLWASLRLLGRGIQQLVWLINDLNARVVGRRWLLLGIAVAVIVGVLVGLREQSDGISLPVAAAPAEMIPTGMAPTALATAIPLQIGRAQVIGTGRDGLIVRDAPGGKRVGKLANGIPVIILAGPQTIANQEDPVWWNVQHGDVMGWVSARFLHPLDAP